MEYNEIQTFLEEHYTEIINIDFKEYGNISYNKKTQIQNSCKVEMKNNQMLKLLVIKLMFP